MDLNKAMWDETIQDLLDNGYSMEEIEKIIPGQQITNTVKGFCKYTKKIAQTTDYIGEGMQSNFSVPNSEGEKGPGIQTPDSDGPGNTGGSYKDRVVVRKQLREQKEKNEIEEKRERRKKLLEKVEAAFTMDQPTAPKPAIAPKPGKQDKQKDNSKKHIKVLKDLDKQVNKVDKSIKKVDKSIKNFEKSTDFLG